MSLELHQPITIAKVNIRKKGPADARILMIDVNLAACCAPDILAHFDPTLRHFLFTDSGNKRMRNLKPIGWDGEMPHMEITIAGERFLGATLTKFKFEALTSGQLALQCVASIHPEGRQTAILADLAGDEVEILITPEMQLDLRMPADTAVPQLKDHLTYRPPQHTEEPAEPAEPVIASAGGEPPNEHGVYPEADETYHWKHHHDSVTVNILELENGDWIHAIDINIGMSSSLCPLARRFNPIALSREGARQAAMSTLVNLYSKGLDSGLSATALTKFKQWVDSGFTQAPRKCAYQHPDNDQLVWTGKGKKPGWVVEWINRGGSLDDLKEEAIDNEVTA